MKNILLQIILILLSHSLFSQTIFFDENNNVISKEEFRNRKIKNEEFKVYNDSLKTAKIVSNRSEMGEIDSEKLINDLNKLLNLEINKDKPTIIIFYPGKDRCNSSGTTTDKILFLAFKEREEKVNKIRSSNFIYVYKNTKGIKAIKTIAWRKDPKNIIENTFFNYHYPCSSYAILYKNKYIDHLGEFSDEFILKDLNTILE